MRYSIYEVLMLFCFYSVIGWCTEVIYATVNSGKFVNRGFLNGDVYKRQLCYCVNLKYILIKKYILIVE